MWEAACEATWKEVVIHWWRQSSDHEVTFDHWILAGLKGDHVVWLDVAVNISSLENWNKGEFLRSSGRCRRHFKHWDNARNKKRVFTALTPPSIETLVADVVQMDGEEIKEEEAWDEERKLVKSYSTQFEG